MAKEKAGASKGQPARKKVATKKLTPQQEAKSESTSAKRLRELAEQSTALARLVAQNASATVPLLEKLGSHSDATVRKWVTLHASTPPKVLAKLATQFPEQLLDNPIFEVLLLENPNLLNELPVGTRRSLLKREKCPLSFMEWLGQDEDEGVQLALAMNPNTPSHILERMAGSVSPKVASAAKRHVRFPKGQERAGPPTEKTIDAALEREILSGAQLRSAVGLVQWLVAHGPSERAVSESLFFWARHQLWRAVVYRGVIQGPSRLVQLLPGTVLERLAEDNDLELRSEVARCSTSPAALRALARDNEMEIRRCVACNEATPVTLLRELAEDNEPEVRAAVASKLAKPVALLRQLARDDEMEIRRCVAWNEATPVTVLRELAEDNEPEVRAAVASKLAKPVALLRQLARDNDMKVRLEVARSARAPVALLHELAQDEEMEIRRAVIQNSAAPPALLRALAGDKESRVRVAIAKNSTLPDVLSGLANDNDEEVRWKVAKNPATPSVVLHALAKKSNPKSNRNVRFLLAENPSLPAAVARMLAADREWKVRKSIAGSPAAPVAVLRELARDKNCDVRNAVAGNCQTPVAVLSELAEAPSENSLRARQSFRARRSVARNEATPAKVLNTLAADSHSWIRGGVAENPATPASAMRTLAGDEAVEVRAIVARNPNTPASAMRTLAGDEAVEVRAFLAQNPNTPAELLCMLAEDEDIYVAVEVARNPASPEFVLRVVIGGDPPSLAVLPKAQRLAKRKEIARAFVDKASLSTPSFRRLLCLLLPDCPTSLLAKSARSTDWKERMAIALHPKTPAAIRQRLGTDGDELVRAAAEAALDTEANSERKTKRK